MLVPSRFHPSRRRVQMMRSGAVLALLALFSQTILALLPMPAQAADWLPHCGMAIQGHGGGDTKGKAAPQPLPDCPVCQAFHLAGHLVTPATINFVFDAPVTGWREVPFDATGSVRCHSQPQQARAPPSV